MYKDTIKIALSEYGNTGITGRAFNKEVLKYFDDIGANWVKDDDTAWCSAFVNWVLKQAHLPFSRSLNARSFLNWGNKTLKPQIGDIVVLWRISKVGVYGHVGFFIKETPNTIFILGGNQNNSVNITEFDKARVLDYRTL